MKRQLKFIMIFLTTVLTFYPQEIMKESKKLTLDVDTAVSLALANNLDIKSEKLKFDSTQWSMFTSFNTFYPTISMSGTIDRSNVEDSNRNQITKTTASMTNPVGINVDTKPIWDVNAAFNISLNINAAMISLRYGRQQLITNSVK